MKNPFYEGDVVYHPTYGKAIVVMTANYSEPAIQISTKEYGCFWTSTQILSFEPWPEPVHERPFPIGWYIWHPTGRPENPQIKKFKSKPLNGELVHFFGLTYPTNLKD